MTNTLTEVAPSIEKLLDKISIAAELYRKASDRVHNEMMTTQFLQQVERKEAYLDQISSALNIEIDDYQPALIARLQVQLEKIGIEVDQLYLRQNAKEVLSFCINREHDLILAYENLLETGPYSSALQQVLVRQLTDANSVRRKLVALHDAYTYPEV
jgi:hypothetical protein